MAAMEQAHVAHSTRDAARIAASASSVKDAEAMQKHSTDEIARLQSGNAGWKVKVWSRCSCRDDLADIGLQYDKLNEKHKKFLQRAAPVVNDSPESSPLRVEARSHKALSPPPSFPAFKIKNTSSLLNPSRQTEFDIELDDDEMESYRDRDDGEENGDLLDQYSPRKKQRTGGILTTLIDRDVNTSFGAKTTSLSKTSADQHIPNLFLSSGKLDAGRKVKGRKGFSR